MVLFRPRCVCFLLFVCLAIAPALSQSATQGAVSGSIADASGSAVANATIIFEQESTHLRTTVRSGADGTFAAQALGPGRWHVWLANGPRANGPAITVRIGRTTALPLLLRDDRLQIVASLDDNAGAGAAAIATSVAPAEISDLPVNGARWQDLAILAPTAAPDTQTGAIGVNGLSSIWNQTTVDGLTTTSAFAAQDNPRTRAAFSLSQSSVREFQVNVANYSAQYGRAAGAVINTVTHRGNSALHGAGFFYARDTSWTSRTPGVALYLPQPDGTLVSQQLPSDYRLQGGIAAGGTVPQISSLNKRLFWHYTYDQQYRNFPALATITNTPQAALSQALPSDSSGFNPVGQSCSDLTGGITHTGPLASTGSETTAALYGTQGACFLNLDDSTLYSNYAQAAAAYNNGLAYIYSLLGVAPRQSTIISNLPRLDYNLNSANTLTLEWNHVSFGSPGGGNSQPFVNDSISSLGSDHLSLDDVATQLTTAITPHAVNEFRAGFAHDSESEYPHPPLPQEPHTALNGAAAPGARIFETLTMGTPPQLPRANYPTESRVQFSEAVAVTHGAHAIRIGGGVIHTSDDVAALQAAAGDYRYDNIQDFLIDYASQSAIPARHCGISGTSQDLCYSSYEQGFGNPALSFATNLFDAYAQDDWRLRDGVTLSFGLRYEYEQLPRPQLANPLLPATARFHADKNNLAPRIGFAWKLPVIPATVLRGGYGIFYGTLPATMLFSALDNTGVITAQSRGQQRYLFTESNLVDAARYPQTLAAPPPPPTSSTPPPGPTVTVLAPNFQNPSVQQASLTAEHSISASTSIHITGLLSLARDLPIAVDTNLAPHGLNNLPGTVTYQFTGGGPLDGQTETVPFYAATKPYTRPNGNFGPINTIESRVNATYSALIVGVRHAATRQLDLRANYTFSHATDYGEQISSTATRNQVLDPYDFAGEHGTSSLNRPQRLIAAAIWHPALNSGAGFWRAAANGWQISPLVQIASGAPYSATLVGTAPAQLNAIGSQNLPPVSYGLLGAGGADFLPLLGRNSFRQPFTQVTDLRIARNLPSGYERLHLRASAEFFNLLNHRNISSATADSAIDTIAYRIGSGQAGHGSSAANPALATFQPGFGQPISANATDLFSSRQLQLSLKAEF